MTENTGRRLPQLRRGGKFALATVGALVGLVGVLAALPWRKQTERVEQSVEVPDGATVELSTFDGDVTVTDTATEYATVTLARHSWTDRASMDDVGLDLSTDDGVTRVTVTHDGDSSAGALGGSLEVALPASVAAVDVRTGDGDVTLTGLDADVTAETADGDVSVTGVGGYVDLHTADGDVVVDGTTGVDEVYTGDGDVVVALASVRDDARVETADGDVHARLGADLDAVVEASTSDGTVTVQDGRLEATSQSGRRFEGRIGAGTDHVTARSADGDVLLSSLE